MSTGSGAVAAATVPFKPRPDIDPEVQALLDCWAALCRWLRRADRHGRRAVVGRMAVCALAFGLFGFVHTFSRPGVPDNLPKAKVNFAQAFDAEGRQVTRDEWISTALGQ